ncbi:MAG: selenide, water dikinase SelD, partial [Pirellulaceae bacterium]
SVEDDEPKYGLVVTGLVSPDRVLTNAGARPGDLLVLTKPIGTGILTTALKRNQLEDAAVRRVVDVMSTLNRSAAEALAGLQVHALTDVTGFGLLGHLCEMVTGSGVGARLRFSAVPVFEEAPSLAQRGLFPGGTKRNLEHFTSSARWSPGTAEVTQYVLADPQTSGGLLIAIASEDLVKLQERLGTASVIGEITAGPPGIVEISD